MAEISVRPAKTAAERSQNDSGVFLLSLFWTKNLECLFNAVDSVQFA